MARNLVVCLDGTGNKPKAGVGTNVELLYSLLDLSDPERQIAYYDPGVGTFAAAGAWTRLARFFSRILGLLFGIGLRENLGQAYTWVIDNYRPGDRIYIFGFSRGAFTARALAGMLYWVGAFRRGADNLVPYAVSAYAFRAEPKPGNTPDPEKTAKKFKPLNHMSEVYAQPVDAQGHRAVPIQYLGVWDTVRAGGILGWDLRWPGTRKLANVQHGRHAISIDEKRRPYREYQVDQALIDNGTMEEAWFAGVHSDVGGTFDKEGDTDEKLSTIALRWVAEDAVAHGLLVRPRRYRNQTTLTDAHAAATLHVMPKIWAVLTYRRRPIPEGAQVHASVLARQSSAAGGYEVNLPVTYTPVAAGWVGPPPPPPKGLPAPTPPAPQSPQRPPAPTG